MRLLLLLALLAAPVAADCYPVAGSPVSVRLLSPLDPQVDSYAVIHLWAGRDGALYVRGGAVHRLAPSVAALAALLFRTITPDSDGLAGKYTVTTRCDTGRLWSDSMKNGTWLLFFLRNHFALEGL